MSVAIQGLLGWSFSGCPHDAPRFGFSQEGGKQLDTGFVLMNPV